MLKVNLHLMNKTPKGSTLDFLQKTFFPKFELLNSGCGLSAGVYGILLLLQNLGKQTFNFLELKSVLSLQWKAKKCKI